MEATTPAALEATNQTALQKRVWGMPRTMRGIVSIIGGILTHLCLGSMYCWGNFVTYLPKSMKFFDGKEHPGVKPDAMMMIPFALVGQMIANPFGAILNGKLAGHVNLVQLFGAWTMVAGVFTSSFTTRLLPFALLYGLLFGLGVGT